MKIIIELNGFDKKEIEKAEEFIVWLKAYHITSTDTKPLENEPPVADMPNFNVGF